MGSYIIVTEPLDQEMQDQLSPKRRMYYDSKNFLNYFRLTPDGRMLWGGRNNLSTTLNLNESAQRLQKQLYAVFPELEKVSITHTWTGKLGITFDLMPHIGKTNEGIHYAFGYGGHGLSIATYLGTEIGLLLHESPQKSHNHDTCISMQNVVLQSLGPQSKPVNRIKRRIKIINKCREMYNYDILLIRGTTPKQYTVFKHCNIPQKSFLLKHLLIVK